VKSTATKRWCAGSIRCAARSAEQFIPVAEKTGLINALGEWVLRTACEEAASWSSPLKVSVNVSPIQLINSSLTDVIVSVLKKRASIRIVWIWRLPSRTCSMKTPALRDPQPAARAGDSDFH
jgi:EAL domain-containing protein (putative c-di-GMP-specific phosphodiesterase class I)